jgi:hypothetical protein
MVLEYWFRGKPARPQGAFTVRKANGARLQAKFFG